MAPLVHEVHVLVEDLHPVVRSICDEQAALRIERQAVRADELAWSGPMLAKRLDELAVAREEDQPVAVLRVRRGRGQWPSAITMLPSGVA